MKEIRGVGSIPLAVACVAERNVRIAVKFGRTLTSSSAVLEPRISLILVAVSAWPTDSAVPTKLAATSLLVTQLAPALIWSKSRTADS